MHQFFSSSLSFFYQQQQKERDKKGKRMENLVQQLVRTYYGLVVRSNEALI